MVEARKLFHAMKMQMNFFIRTQSTDEFTNPDNMQKKNSKQKSIRTHTLKVDK